MKLYTLALTDGTVIKQAAMQARDATASNVGAVILEVADVLCCECKHFNTDTPPCGDCLNNDKKHWSAA